MFDFLVEDERNHLLEAQERMRRVDVCGTSARDGRTVDDLIECNRAGPGESKLTREEIIEQYCRNPPE
jgi:hypothetical protein